MILGAVLVIMNELEARILKPRRRVRNQMQTLILEFFLKLLCIPDTMLLDLLGDAANSAGWFLLQIRHLRLRNTGLVQSKVWWMQDILFCFVAMAFETGSCYVTQENLELSILLPLPPKCWIIAIHHYFWLDTRLPDPKVYSFHPSTPLSA